MGLQVKRIRRNNVIIMRTRKILIIQLTEQIKTITLISLIRTTAHIKVAEIMGINNAWLR